MEGQWRGRGRPHVLSLDAHPLALRALAVLSCLTLAPANAQRFIDGHVDVDTFATWTLEAIGTPGELAIVLVSVGLDPTGGLVTGFGTLRPAHRELVACAQIAFLNPVTSALQLSATGW